MLVLEKAVAHLTRVQQEFDELIETTGEYETELEENKAALEERLSEANHAQQTVSKKLTRVEQEKADCKQEIKTLESQYDKLQRQYEKAV